MEPGGKQPPAKIEPLVKRVAESGIQHNPISPGRAADRRHLVQKTCANASSSHALIDDEIVERVHEAAPKAQGSDRGYRRIPTKISYKLNRKFRSGMNRALTPATRTKQAIIPGKISQPVERSGA